MLIRAAWELHAKFGGGGVVAAHGHRSLAPSAMAWLSETPIAFARWCLCGIETDIAFAGEKWAFLVQCSGAEVMRVS